MAVEPVTVVAVAVISKHYLSPSLCWAMLVGMDRYSPQHSLCPSEALRWSFSAGSWTRAHIWVVMQSKVGSDDLPEAPGLLSADPSDWSVTKPQPMEEGKLNPCLCAIKMPPPYLKKINDK